MFNNPKRTNITVNGSGGAFVNIPCSFPKVMRMEITEEQDSTGAAAAFQGLTYTLLDDAHVTQYQNVPGDTIKLGRDGQFPGIGTDVGSSVIPIPNGTTRAADIVVKVRSQTAAGTRVIVLEYA